MTKEKDSYNNSPLNPYEAKQEARRSYYEQQARKASERSQERYAAARDQVEAITPGQPILVGHHSEKRHRRALEKCSNYMDQAINASEKSDYYVSKAASVGTGGVSTDDPDAVQKLKQKLAIRVARQEIMKRVNKVWRQCKKQPNALTTQKAFAALSDEERDIITKFKESGQKTPWGMDLDYPFESFKLKI